MKLNKTPMKKIFSLLIALFMLFSNSVFAFIVQQIRFDGLQHFKPATVETYLPIKPGDNVTEAKTPEILRALYKTGFFEQISLSRENNNLIIHVVERPTIGQLKISGNSVIQTDKLTSVMKTLDIAEGRVYNPEVLERIKQSLLNQYYQLGRYNARVTITTTPMSRNRVAVNVVISEGLIAKIKRITIIGNHAFSEATLVKQLDMSTSGIFSFFTQNDRYSEEKLNANLDKLRNYYLDRGYLRVEIKSSQAQISPDRKTVYITIVVMENAPYYIEKCEVQSGNLLVPREEIIKRIQLKAGDTFSRQAVLDSEKSISDYYGDQGYLFASINLRPQVNDNTHKVIILFDINPGKRTYVHHVSFTDNMRTNDVVLRREVTQMEAAPASNKKLEDSKHRLLLLPYIKEAEMSVKPTPDSDDQVDVDYKVKEDTAAQASVKLGYSAMYGVVVGAGFNQKNFLGTGNTLGINFNRSTYEQFYGIDYTNPYFTPEGISRSLSFSVSRTDPGSMANGDTGYITNEYDLGMMFTIPIGQEANAFDRLVVGGTYQNTLINLNTGNPSTISNQVNTYITNHGRRFQEGDLRIGLTRDSRDRAMFPTSGSVQTLFFDGFVPLAKDSVFFYTANYHAKLYQPIYGPWIFVTRGDLGYANAFDGTRNYPFFRNYFTGGIDSVRGYQGFSLGPLDSNGKSYGGNMLFDGSVGLIFPNYISENLRTTWFVDGGNVYSSLNNRLFGGASTNTGPLRYSSGIEADWLTPFGPIELSIAEPLNFHRGHDQMERFQFALGANF